MQVSTALLVSHIFTGASLRTLLCLMALVFLWLTCERSAYADSAQQSSGMINRTPLVEAVPEPTELEKISNNLNDIVKSINEVPEEESVTLIAKSKKPAEKKAAPVLAKPEKTKVAKTKPKKKKPLPAAKKTKPPAPVKAKVVETKSVIVAAVAGLYSTGVSAASIQGGASAQIITPLVPLK